MPPAAAPPVRAPARPPPDAVLLAVRRSTAGRAEIRAVYLFEQPDPPPGEPDDWALHVGVELAPGADAAAVLPPVVALLRTSLPAGAALRLCALSRRRLAVVRRSVAPL